MGGYVSLSQNMHIKGEQITGILCNELILKQVIFQQDILVHT